MSGPTVEVEGLNNFVRTLRKAGEDLEELKDAHARAASIVATAAAERAPRRSGTLAASVRGSRQVRRARIQAGRAAVPYAGPIHWGWPARGIKADPFITLAARATEPQWVKQYLDDVQTALDNVRGI